SGRPADRTDRGSHAGAPRRHEGERGPAGAEGLDENQSPVEIRRRDAAPPRGNGALVRERPPTGARLGRPEDGNRGRRVPPRTDPRGRRQGVRERRAPVRRGDGPPPRPCPDPDGPRVLHQPGTLLDLPRQMLPEPYD